MMIRRATEADVPTLVAIYERARAFMRENGNPTQWNGAYPAAEDVREDIARNQGYVVVADDGVTVLGTFALVPGAEPTYAVIADGSWASEAPYATIHRIASSGAAHGIARAIFAFCRQQWDHLRIDTHTDNIPMQRAIEHAGFERRGTIWVEDGTPRIAFEYVARGER